jgi:DNA-binding CsgD family transcriptional regulator
MYTKDDSNRIFNLAAELVNHTARHVFITGKAGTGKTTFLKWIRENTEKNVVIVAPTGVAAINASGVTAHSFFQLPFGPFIPGPGNNHGAGAATDRHQLFRNTRFATARRELFQEMELLIIDEVSMIRCDMLDAIDAILRHFRKQPQVPFGGVQVVYIGDMFQLPPVIPSHEWEILREYYASPFFFEAKAVKEAPPLYIELKKIYRQNEQHFIDILNRIRNNNPIAEDLDELNKKFDPEFNPPEQEKYITLTTHNRKADVINEAALSALEGKLYSFEAEINGEFSEKALPTEQHLQLKEGAQVMFIRNDTGEARRFYNGKLGVVKKISDDEIIVSLGKGENDLKIEKETWRNIRYNYNKENSHIEEEELGSFKQYPIRLAWAITIHKSQGLTFEKAVIDAGSSFAAGQVYVALSRCTSLSGLVLHSRISKGAIATDPRILEFAQREANDDYLEELLVEEKKKFQAENLVKAFGWEKILKVLVEWKENIEGKKLPAIDSVLDLNRRLILKAGEQVKVAEKFQYQLRQLIEAGDLAVLEERVNKGILYFSRLLLQEIVEPIREHVGEMKYVSKVKKYLQQVKAMEPVIITYLDKINSLRYQEISFLKYDFRRPEQKEMKTSKKQKSKKEKQEKGATRRDSLELFRQGKTVKEIAEIRNLAPTTVEGHLASFVYSGEIDIAELVSYQKTTAILKLIDAPDIKASTIKNMLGPEYSYGEIKAVISYYRLIQENKPVADQRPI